MVRPLAFLFLACLCARGQAYTFNDESFMGAAAVASWTPASLGNLVGWWLVEGGYATNGATVTLTDNSTKGYHLTNSANTTNWPIRQVAALNGHDTLLFDGVNDYLTCIGYTNTQPYEIWVVMRYWNSIGAATSTRVIFDSASVAGRNAFSIKPTPPDQTTIFAGTEIFPSVFKTNQWVIATAIFNGAAGNVLTNNTPGVAGNLGAQNSSGITLASRYAFDAGRFAAIDVAEIVSCSTTNTAANRTLLTNYFLLHYNGANIIQ